MKNHTYHSFNSISHYLITLLIVFILSTLGTAQEKEQTTKEIDQKMWKQAVDIAKRIIIIDCHSHDLLKPVSRKFPKQVDFEMVKKTGVNGVVQAYPIDPRKKDNLKEYIISELKQFHKVINKGTKQIFNGKEFSKNKNSLGILLGLESSRGVFEGNLESLKQYHELGIRTISINNGGKDTIYVMQGDNYQLSEFGIKLVKKMNTFGIACDITHMPDNMRQKLINFSKAPVYVSHANVRGVVSAEFNVSDATLSQLTQKGGVLCLTFYSEYVSEDCLAQRGKAKSFKDFPRANVEEFVNHIDYIKNKVGVDFICIGSDYGGSGRLAPKGLETIEGFHLIIYHMLKRSYTEEEINKVMGLNFIHYLKRVEKYTNISD